VISGRGIVVEAWVAASVASLVVLPIFPVKLPAKRFMQVLFRYFFNQAFNIIIYSGYQQ
jgi:hypothetical protein